MAAVAVPQLIDRSTVHKEIIQRFMDGQAICPTAFELMFSGLKGVIGGVPSFSHLAANGWTDRPYLKAGLLIAGHPEPVDLPGLNDMVEQHDVFSQEVFAEFLTRVTDGMLDAHEMDNIQKMVASAVLFKDQWVRPFDQSQIREVEYPSGRRTMMYDTSHRGYWEGDLIHSVAMDYQGGAKLIVCKTKDPQGSLDDPAVQEAWETLFGSLFENLFHEDKINLAFPIIDITWNYKIDEALKQFPELEEWEGIHMGKLIIDAEGTQMAASAVSITRSIPTFFHINDQEFFFVLTDGTNVLCHGRANG